MAEQALSVTEAWIVPSELAELRLDAFVRRCLPHLSRRQIEKAIAAKVFSVAGRTIRKGDRLASGDQVKFHGPAAWLAAHPWPEAEIVVPIVYEDSWIIIVNKPAGMPAHGFSACERGTLANFVLGRWPALANVGPSRWQPGLVHRIDIETSGLVVIAKTNSAYVGLRSQFAQRRVQKIYWALVRGSAGAQGLISLPLARGRGDGRRMRPVQPEVSGGEEKTWTAITRYRTIGRARGLSLLEVDMETGVRHQIRAHLAAIGHPIVGDALYGDSETETVGLKRHFLHARRMSLRHPESKKTLTVAAELPDDLVEVLGRLRIKP